MIAQKRKITQLVCYWPNKLVTDYQTNNGGVDEIIYEGDDSFTVHLTFTAIDGIEGQQRGCVRRLKPLAYFFDKEESSNGGS